MKFKISVLFILFLTFSVKAQNWNAFNKAYRYNYVYDYNALVTNVLFADSVKTSGSDTIYYMNRIGVECTGSCPTITAAITTTATVIVPNMPQFLQRTIIKKSNGIVQLKDTGNWVIKPTCTLTETWIFDSVSLKTAQCVNISTLNIFSVVDSVKTIIADGIDTILLSKQFGLIQFPNMYGKNKYYRLVGIENSSSYDQTGLYGYKVPNGWDFYNYDIGDKFCNHGTSYYVSGPSNTTYTYWDEEVEVISKVIVPNVGYNYNIIKRTQLNSTSCCPTYYSSYTVVATSLNYTLTGNSTENKMYPGQMRNWGSWEPNNFWNLTKFGLDNKNKFYKYYGTKCQIYPNVTLPDLNTFSAFTKSGTFFSPDSKGYTVTFGEGLGCVSSLLDYVSGMAQSNCLTCAVKGGTLYLGTETFLSVEEKNKESYSVYVYPNPTSNNITVEANGSNFDVVEICNILGQKILFKETKGLNKTELNLTELNTGIYFLKVYLRDKLIKVEKIIKE